jgi:hypothetical protein
MRTVREASRLQTRPPANRIVLLNIAWAVDPLRRAPPYTRRAVDTTTAMA